MSFFEYLSKNITYVIVVLIAVVLVIIAGLLKIFVFDKIVNKKNETRDNSEE